MQLSEKVGKESMKENLKIKLMIMQDRLENYKRISNKYPVGCDGYMYVSGVIFAFEEVISDLERLIYEN